MPPSVQQLKLPPFLLKASLLWLRTTLTVTGAPSSLSVAKPRALPRAQVFGPCLSAPAHPWVCGQLSTLYSVHEAAQHLQNARVAPHSLPISLAGLCLASAGQVNPTSTQQATHEQVATWPSAESNANPSTIRAHSRRVNPQEPQVPASAPNRS